MPRQNTKKILLTALVLAVILLIVGIAVWFFFFRNTKSVEQKTFFDFLPFGLSGEGTEGEFSGSTNGKTRAGNGDDSGETSALPILRQISNVPTAGAMATSTRIFRNGTSTAITVRYLERATGHVYDTRVDTMEKKRVTNTTIPRVYEALFNKNGTFAILRYLDDDEKTIETFIGKIPESDAGREGTLTGEFLPRDTKDVSVSPTKDEIYYLTENKEGSDGFVASLKNPAQRTRVFSFPFTEWISQWPAVGTITLTSKASYAAAGYAYSLSLDGKTEVEKLIGGFSGLTTLVNNDFSRAIFSSASQNRITLHFVNPKTHASIPTVFGTLPEKCVWGKDGISLYCGIPGSLPRAAYPDEWYQGVVSFTDSIWKIDTDTWASFDLLEPGDLGSNFDIIKPFLSPDERYLFFTNKKDMTLWVFDLHLAFAD